MKKIIVVAVIAAMMAALLIPAFADSHADTVEAGDKLLEADFSGDELAADELVAWSGYVLQDGALHLGSGGDWVASSPIVRTAEMYSNYVATLKFYGDKRDCYYGFGIRTNNEFQLMNGGRFGVLSPSETAVGIAVDIFGAGNSTLGNNIGITFCDGGENASAPAFTLARPEGFDPGAAAEFTIVDSGDKITIRIDGKELVTIELSGLADGAYTAAKAYDAAGNEVFSGDVTVLDEGTIQIYQRNNHVVINEISVSEIKKAADPQPATTPVLRGRSFDAFVTNYINIATGEYTVADLGPVDGSNGSISNVAFYGWVGFDEAVDSFGYKINGNEPVYDSAFSFTTEDAVKAAENGGEFGQRFLIVVPTADLKGTNTIKACVKLASGTVIDLDGSVLTEGGLSLPNTVVEYTGPAATEPDPGDEPQTGDATMILFVVAAAAVALVILKKKAF